MTTFNLANFCALTTLLIVFILLICIRKALKLACKRLRIQAYNANAIVRFTSLGLILWIAILSFLSYLEFFIFFDSIPPRIALVFIPPIILIFFLLQHRFFRLLLKALSEQSLIYFQSFRIIVELMFYMLFTISLLPYQMTFLGLNHDVIVGITALIAGNLFFFKNHRQQVAAILWNVSGIIMLINIVTITALSAPSTFRVFLNDPSSSIIGTFPYILIPGFIVPVALGVHLFSIKQLLLNGR